MADVVNIIIEDDASPINIVVAQSGTPGWRNWIACETPIGVPGSTRTFTLLNGRKVASDGASNPAIEVTLNSNVKYLGVDYTMTPGTGSFTFGYDLFADDLVRIFYYY